MINATPAMRDQARLKSYTWQAIATFLLYFCFVIPGLIANVVFLLEAVRMEEIAGERLPGVWMLRGLIALQVFGVLLVVALIMLAAVGEGLSRSIHWLFDDPRPILYAVIIVGVGLGIYLAWRAQKPY
jgi:hypothetical protein